MFRDDFAPFRVFTNIVAGANSDFFAQWHSWLVNNRNELQLYVGTPEPCDDHQWMLVDLNERFNHVPLVSRLNADEEQKYKDRLKTLSDRNLDKQLDLWNLLQSESPQFTSQIGRVLEYPPVRFIQAEIQSRLFKPAKKSKPRDWGKDPEGKKVWNGTKKEFADFVIDQREKHPRKHTSDSLAAEILFAQYVFPNFKWTISRCQSYVRKRRSVLREST